jgi:hypothetical protein
VASNLSTYAVVTRARPPEYTRYVIANPWFLSGLALLLFLGLVANALPSSVLATALALALAVAAPLLPPVRRCIGRRLEAADRARLAADLDAERRSDVRDLERLVAEVSAVTPERRPRLDRLLDGFVRAAVVERQLRQLLEATGCVIGDGELPRRRRREVARMRERAASLATRMARIADLMRLGHQHWIHAALATEAARLAELTVDDELEVWEAIECPEVARELELLEAHDPR